MSISPSWKMPQAPVAGASAWYGCDLISSTDWIITFSKSEKLEIELAMKNVVSRRLRITEIQKEDFPLPTLTKKLALIQQDLLEGRGFLLLRGIEVDKYSIEENAIIYFGIGAHFGYALPQNAKGHVIGHIKDVGLDHKDPNVRI